MSATLETLCANAPELARRGPARLGIACRASQGSYSEKFYGYSGKEIATRLGIPDEAVEELLIQGAQVCAQEITTGVSERGAKRFPARLAFGCEPLTNDDRTRI
jgi:hypothetical protein